MKRRNRSPTPTPEPGPAPYSQTALVMISELNGILDVVEPALTNAIGPFTPPKNGDEEKMIGSLPDICHQLGLLNERLTRINSAIAQI